MIRFDKEQVVIDVAGVKVGGQPGEYPTVLAGTIFYGGHNIISDEKAGVFDKDAAEERIKTMEEMQDVTGNPCIVQTFGATPEAIVKYLEFVGDICEAPFMIDSTSAEAKVAGAKYADEAGLAERAIYNSINMASEADELAAVAETDISASIVLGFNPMEAGVEGKINIWENGGSVLDKGLMEMAEECGITKPFMDVAITPLGQGAGPALRTSYAVKSKWGLPVGSGIHNVPSAWDWLRTYKKPVEKGGLGHAEAWPVCDVGSNLIQQSVGGDFVLFGPIENARMAFPACGMADIFMAEAAKDIGTEPVEEHPINKLL
ncbi:MULTISPECIES: tetrahydromethanopterin S-methyltransferase subunit H [Methanobacterium]|jgi:tetrahydromethanopterin S-methyltransferase subunit H|uniref:Tetrahydromethanopterin S-methyltransferase subunit H n=1 Tax=Methanobacterium formicicum TaxID=2162 RepID=A0A090I5H7_METFO|nr:MULTISPECIES: tetrahydromethanopterin S-methyltransferase subunit H [Methanobacterium]AIS31744.1 tetrahydromethanopterin S-methyltransferase subunit H MtrH [Methanobacterium formicicum]KUK75006.1 MAG: Tetrahydromethanopterin S-methyltransferase subunit H [Methanobacterium sp. 42_16]MBF4473865.1 tetrahydromethanopterin S-methyltransferase subunit H [Methanobacterium formicicum]MDD4811257.1 tetrahydromethanopterin S-methyltransferase subunit H [Methanobacterium formicicum]MDG3548192.1 tetrahy